MASSAAVVGNGVEIATSRLYGGGFGLFATKEFQPGQLITTYDGDLMNTGRCTRHTNPDPVFEVCMSNDPRDAFASILCITT